MEGRGGGSVLGRGGGGKEKGITDVGWGRGSCCPSSVVFLFLFIRFVSLPLLQPC